LINKSYKNKYTNKIKSKLKLVKTTDMIAMTKIRKIKKKKMINKSL